MSWIFIFAIACVFLGLMSLLFYWSSDSEDRKYGWFIVAMTSFSICVFVCPISSGINYQKGIQ